MSQLSNEDVEKLIISGELNWQDAKRTLSLRVADKDISTSEKLRCYYFLTMICTEQRKLDEISKIYDEVNALELNGSEEHVQYARFLYATAIAWTIENSNVNKAREYFDKAQIIARKEKNQDLIFKCCYAQAELLRSEGEYNRVFDLEKTLIEYAEVSSEPIKNRATVCMLVANINRKIGNYEEAIIGFNNSKEVLSIDRNSPAYLYNLWALGTCYAAIEDEEKAKIYLDLATQSTGPTNSEINRINILSRMTLAELNVVVGNYEQAENHYSEMEKAINGDDTSYYGRRLLRGQALLEIKKGDFERSNELIDKLVVMAAGENKHKEIMRLRLLKAEVLLRTGEASQHEQALTMLQETLAYHKNVGSKRHTTVCLEVMARLNSRMGYPKDALNRILEMSDVTRASNFDRMFVRAQLIAFTLKRKLGESPAAHDIKELMPIINKLNMSAERVILKRFEDESYDEWTSDLKSLDPYNQRYVNEFFEDFHFVPEQSTDMEIDPNSHYVREKHLGEIPFHNKFTLMRILLLLAEDPGREFSKEEFAQKIWDQEYNPLRHDNNIYININRLRKLVEPNPRESRYIMNGSRGYYFNPAMKVNISTHISKTAPRLVHSAKAGEIR